MGTRDVCFVNLATQLDNVGDVLLMRELLRLLRPHARLVLDVRACDAPYLAQLDLAPGDTCFARGAPFYAEMTRVARAGGRVTYLRPPGGPNGELPAREFGRRVVGLARMTCLRAVFGVQIYRRLLRGARAAPRAADPLAGRVLRRAVGPRSAQPHRARPGGCGRARRRAGPRVQPVRRAGA